MSEMLGANMSAQPSLASLPTPPVENPRRPEWHPSPLPPSTVKPVTEKKIMAAVEWLNKQQAKTKKSHLKAAVDLEAESGSPLDRGTISHLREDYPDEFEYSKAMRKAAAALAAEIGYHIDRSSIEHLLTDYPGEFERLIAQRKDEFARRAAPEVDAELARADLGSGGPMRARHHHHHSPSKQALGEEQANERQRIVGVLEKASEGLIEDVCREFPELEDLHLDCTAPLVAIPRPFWRNKEFVMRIAKKPDCTHALRFASARLLKDPEVFAAVKSVGGCLYTLEELDKDHKNPLWKDRDFFLECLKEVPEPYLLFYESPQFLKDREAVLQASKGDGYPPEDFVIEYGDLFANDPEIKKAREDRELRVNHGTQPVV